MFARSMSGREEWAKIENTIPFVRERMEPAVTSIDGNVGLVLLLALHSQRFIVISGWQDEAAMRASDDTIAPLRAEAAEQLGGTTSVKEWEVAALRNTSSLRPGNWVSVSLRQRDAAELDAIVSAFRSTVLPATAELRGCQGAVLLLNRESGRVAVAVTFESYTALHGAHKSGAPLHDLSVAGVSLPADDITEYEVDTAELSLPASI